MALVDSLLTAMVRANGDALVMHVGEKPIVIAGSRTIDLSSHGLNLAAMTGMLGQLLPVDAQAALREFGAVEHVLPSRGADRFTVIAARGGDDVWIEIRRRREKKPEGPDVAAAPELAAPTDDDRIVLTPEPATDEIAEPMTVPQTVPAMASVTAAPPTPTTTTITPTTPMEVTPSFGPPAGDTPPPAPPPVPPAAAEPPEAAPPPVAAQEAEVPVTRTVRIEVPSRTAPVRTTRAERLLRAAVARGATELFVMSQERPHVRVDGSVRVLGEESPLAAAEVETLVAEVTPEPSRDVVQRGEAAEWVIEVPEVGRVRCTAFHDHRGAGVNFQLLALRPASAEQLGLGADARMLATEPDGLVVVGGPTRADRSALVAAFVDAINRARADYIITLEPQVQVPHGPGRALISQREVGVSEERAVAAARGALGENPDVLVIEDLASDAVAPLAIEAADRDRLVIVSVDAQSSAGAVQRLLELVPADARPAARAAMARSLRGALVQMTVRRVSGGRAAVREVLPGAPAVSRALTEDPAPELVPALDAARGSSAKSLVDTLVEYVRSGAVDVREAFRKAPDPARLVAALRASGYDTTPIDRFV